MISLWDSSESDVFKVSLHMESGLPDHGTGFSIFGARAFRNYSRIAKRAIQGFFALSLALGAIGPNPFVSAEDPLSGLLKRHFPVSSSNRRDNGEMLQLFRPWANEVGKSVVQVLTDGTPTCLGMVVAPDGLIVTKRSELSGEPLTVRLPSGEVTPVTLLAARRESDLALLKVTQPVNDWIPIRLAESDTSPIGSFIFSVGRGGMPIGLGTVSAKERSVPHQGRLGMFLMDHDGHATVEHVWPTGGAAAAGVREGDRIVAIDGRNETNRLRVIESLRERFPGESVRLTIRRGKGETLDLVAKIQDVGMMQESENDSKINGPRSTRLSGFERAMQHDTVINPDQCGGPVVDTSGRVVGMNIARAGRVVSYALPSTLVRAAIDRMTAESANMSASK